MNGKNILKALAILAIVTLGLFVSCSDNVVEEKLLEDKLVYATFDKRSRTLTESSYTQSFELKDVSEVYWTYEASKSSGDLGGKTGVTTSQTAVKSSLDKGLDGSIGPFSQGKWDFDVYGYKNKTTDVPTSGTSGTDYVSFVVKEENEDKTYYYTDKIYYGSATGVTLKSGTENNPDPINVIINIVTEGDGTFAITNTSEFHWKDDNGNNPTGVYLKLVAKTEDEETTKTEYIALTTTKVSDTSDNYYYKLSEDKSFTWSAGYWTVTCSIVQATVTDDSVYTDNYTYAESSELFVKVYAGQTTKLEAKVIEENLAYGVIKPKIVDGIATTTVTTQVVANTATVLSSSLTPASAADTSLDTSKVTKVTVPATVKEFQATAENATVTAALTVSATPIETANKTIVASNNGKAVNAIDLKAVVKTTTTSGDSAETTETDVEKFTDAEGRAVPVLVDTYIEAGLEDVELYYTYADDYKDSADATTVSSKAGKTEYWDAQSIPDDYNESTSSESLTVPDVSTATETRGVCYYDKASGRIIFRTTHFSSFVVTAKAAVAINKTAGTIYTSLSDAISNAEVGATLTLLDNVTLDSEISLNKSLTLDMSFYTVEVKKLTIAEDGCLTIKNSSADQAEDMFEAEAKIGASSSADGTYCYSLKNALDKAVKNDTVKLLDNVELAEARTLDKAITIDLCEKTLTMKDSLTVSSKGSLTLEDGAVVSNAGSYGIILTADAALKLESVNYTASGRAIRINEHANNAVLEVISSTVETTGGAFAIQTDATKEESTNVKVTIKDSTVKADKNKTAEDDNDSTGFMFNVNGTVNIDNSKFYGRRQGAIFRGGVYTVKNSTFESTVSTYKKDSYLNGAWGTGNEVPVAALVVGNHVNGTESYPYATSVTFEGENTLLVQGEVNQIYVYQNDDKHTVKVSGTINTEWTVNTNMNGASYPCATIDNGSTYYTLEEAVTTAKSNQTIKLFRDLDLTYYIKVNGDQTGKGFELGKGVTLDLNEKTITVNNYGIVWRGEDITIQNGNFVASEGGSYALFIRGNDYDSKLDGVETNARANWTATVNNITTTGGVNVGCHKLVIKNSNIKGTKYYALFLDANSEITVESGTYTSNSTEAGCVLSSAKAGTGKIVIKGGTFTGSGNVSVFTTEKARQNFEVSGGTFSSNPLAYVADGYVAEKNTDGTWTVVKYETGKEIHISNLAELLPESNQMGFNSDSKSTAEIVIDGKNAYVVDEWQDLWFGGNVTIKNVTFAKGISLTARTTKEMTVTIEGCTINYCNQLDLLTGENANKLFRIDNSGNGLCLNIDAPNTKTDDWENSRKSKITVVISGCTLIGDGSDTAEKKDSWKKREDYTSCNGDLSKYVDTDGKTKAKGRGNGIGLGVVSGNGNFLKNVTINGCTFKNLRNAALQIYDGFTAQVTVSNCTFESWGVNKYDKSEENKTDERDYTYAIRGAAGSASASVTLTNCTFNYTANEFKNSKFKLGVHYLDVTWTNNGNSATTTYNSSKKWDEQVVSSTT